MFALDIVDSLQRSAFALWMRQACQPLHLVRELKQPGQLADLLGPNPRKLIRAYRLNVATLASEVDAHLPGFGETVFTAGDRKVQWDLVWSDVHLQFFLCEFQQFIEFTQGIKARTLSFYLPRDEEEEEDEEDDDDM